MTCSHAAIGPCNLHWCGGVFPLPIRHSLIRGVKMFPTKTSWDKTVDGVSDALVAAWKNQLVEKVQEQGVFSDSVTTQSTFAAFKTHFGYIFTIPASGNILMRHCWGHDQHLLKYVGHHIILCITIIICPATHARKIIMNSIWLVANHLYWGWYHVR